MARGILPGRLQEEMVLVAHHHQVWRAIGFPEQLLQRTVQGPVHGRPFAELLVGERRGFADEHEARQPVVLLRQHDAGVHAVECRIADHPGQSEADRGQELDPGTELQNGTGIDQRTHAVRASLTHLQRDHRAQGHPHQVYGTVGVLVHGIPHEIGHEVEGVGLRETGFARRSAMSGQVHQQEVVVLAQPGDLAFPGVQAAAGPMEQHQPGTLAGTHMHFMVKQEGSVIGTHARGRKISVPDPEAFAFSPSPVRKAG